MKLFKKFSGRKDDIFLTKLTHKYFFKFPLLNFFDQKITIFDNVAEIFIPFIRLEN